MIGRNIRRLARAAGLAIFVAAAPALAGEAAQVPHGMVVTTDAGDKVRVLAFADGTFRVTVASDPAAAPLSPMVVRQADGEPLFRSDARAASLAMPQASAVVGLADGRLTI